MALQARGKDRFIFDLGGIFKKTGDISCEFLPLLSFKMLGSSKKMWITTFSKRQALKSIILIEKTA